MEQRNEENQIAKESNANATTMTAPPPMLYTHTLASSDGGANAVPPMAAAIERAAKMPGDNCDSMPSETTDVVGQIKASSPPPEGVDENKPFPVHDDHLFEEVMRAQLDTATPAIPAPDTAATLMENAQRTTCSPQQPQPQIETPRTETTTATTGVTEKSIVGGTTYESAVTAEMDTDTTPTTSIRSIGSIVCRICHNAENPEKLVSPCLCKGSLTYVHIYCLERWISTSRSTICELCRFQYNTEQALRYTCVQSLRMWYSRSMSRRALQEDCQMFSLLTLIALCLIGVLLIGLQYYFLQGPTWAANRIWTKGWLLFFLFTTLAVYFVNIYMIVRSQLEPWYRWWQSARDIKLVLENRRPIQYHSRKVIREQLPLASTSAQSPHRLAAPQQHPQVQATQPQPPPMAPPSQPALATIVSIGTDANRTTPKMMRCTRTEQPRVPLQRYIDIAHNNNITINMTPTHTARTIGSGGRTTNAAIASAVSENPTACNMHDYYTGV